jgi:HEAT repeat protein
MIANNDEQISSLLRQMNDEDHTVRINAINELGEIGDELCLRDLRERLKYLTKEHQALIIAVGKLKKKLGIQQY